MGFLDSASNISLIALPTSRSRSYSRCRSRGINKPRGIIFAFHCYLDRVKEFNIWKIIYFTSNRRKIYMTLFYPTSVMYVVFQFGS